mmetsp:Transcript_930/g.2109  ORF Transcript_930/g.2109 Transcript_930/m.2109 type:complete len:482 (-) Transcript_930:237-1682(-)
MVATVAPSSPVHTSTGAPAAPMAHDDISSMMRRAIRLSVPAVRLQQSAENPGATHAAYEVCLHAVGKHSADAVLVLSSWRRWSECATFAREKGVAKRFPSHPADALSFLGVNLQPGSLERRRKQLEEYLQAVLVARPVELVNFLGGMRALRLPAGWLEGKRSVPPSPLVRRAQLGEAREEAEAGAARGKEAVAHAPPPVVLLAASRRGEERDGAPQCAVDAAAGVDRSFDGIVLASGHEDEEEDEEEDEDDEDDDRGGEQQPIVEAEREEKDAQVQADPPAPLQADPPAERPPPAEAAAAALHGGGAPVAACGVAESPAAEEPSWLEEASEQLQRLATPAAPPLRASAELLRLLEARGCAHCASLLVAHEVCEPAMLAGLDVEALVKLTGLSVGRAAALLAAARGRVEARELRPRSVGLKLALLVGLLALCCQLWMSRRVFTHEAAAIAAPPLEVECAEVAPASLVAASDASLNGSLERNM